METLSDYNLAYNEKRLLLLANTYGTIDFLFNMDTEFNCHPFKILEFDESKDITKINNEDLNYIYKYVKIDGNINMMMSKALPIIDLNERTYKNYSKVI